MAVVRRVFVLAVVVVALCAAAVAGMSATVPASQRPVWGPVTVPASVPGQHFGDRRYAISHAPQ